MKDVIMTWWLGEVVFSICVNFESTHFLWVFLIKPYQVRIKYLQLKLRLLVINEIEKSNSLWSGK